MSEQCYICGKETPLIGGVLFKETSELCKTCGSHYSTLCDTYKADKEEIDLAKIHFGNILRRNRCYKIKPKKLQLFLDDAKRRWAIDNFSRMFIKNIKVTTGDFHEPYEVIGPVFFSTSNKGKAFSNYDTLKFKYKNKGFAKDVFSSPDEFESWPGLDMTQLLSLIDPAATFEGNVGHQSFSTAFYISIAELKQKAFQMGGDGIVSMKMDFDLDTTNYGAFYLQMYGTVVKRNRLDSELAKIDQYKRTYYIRRPTYTHIIKK